MGPERQPRNQLLEVSEILRQLREGPEQIQALTTGLSAADLSHEAIHVPQIEGLVGLLRA